MKARYARRMTRGLAFALSLTAAALLSGCPGLVGGDDSAGNTDNGAGATAAITVNNALSQEIVLFAGSYSLGSPGSSSIAFKTGAVQSGAEQTSESFPAEKPLNVWYGYEDRANTGSIMYEPLFQRVAGKLSLFNLEENEHYVLRIGPDSDRYEVYLEGRGGQTPQAVAPRPSLEPGSYEGAQTVALTTPTQYATIYYTDDGSPPDLKSEPYKGAFIIDSETQVRAVAVADGHAESPELKVDYLITKASTADTQAPEVTAFSAMGKEVTHETVWFHALEGTDNTGIVAWSVTVDENTRGESKIIYYWYPVKPDFVEISSSGSYRVHAKARDANKRESNRYSITVDVDLDNRAPAVTAFSGPKTVTSPEVTFHELTGSDNVGIEAWLVREYDTTTTTPPTPTADDPGWSTAKPDRLTLPSPGEYRLYAWAKDPADNISLADSFNVTYQ